MNAQIYEEASEWVVRHRTADLDAYAKRRFDAWLRESPQHVRAYLEMAAIWEDVPSLDANWNAGAEELIARARAERNVFPLGGEPQPETVVSAVDGEGADRARVLRAPDAPSDVRRATKQSENVYRARINRKAFFSIAASLLIVLGLAGWLYLLQGVHATGIGEQRVIALADGSSIELNARSKIRVRYTDGERAIDLLQGQALFRVGKDPNRPFVVASGETRVRAVGTQFDVYRKRTGTVVTVVEGRVAVRAPPRDRASTYAAASDSGPEAESQPPRRARTPESRDSWSDYDPVYLSAGEQLLISTTAPILPKLANLEATTAWTRQRLVFDFAPLTEVAEEFNRYNRRPLVIDDPSLHDFHVSGTFSSTDSTLLLRFLRAQSGIVVSETDSEIRISRREPAAASDG